MATATKLSAVIDIEQTPDEKLSEILERQRKAFLQHGAPSYEERIGSLKKLEKQIIKYQDELTESLRQDFGNRSRHESLLAEVMPSLNALKHTKKHLKDWMKPKKRPTSINFALAKNRIIYQPMGVIGIMSPWNYPAYLCFSPLTEALAAGNRVMIKPSELTPNTSTLIHKMISEVYAEEEVAVELGGPEVGAAFSSLPFDHLLYTGSTRVGRLVMKTAADKMVPVTLELGGKSPTIIDEEFDMQRAVNSICTGKLMNAGQTCIAPDYLFVPESRKDSFVATFKETAAKMYPTLANNPDYTSIVNDNHYERITRLIQDAVEKGATVVQVNPASESLEGTRKIAPTLVLGATEDMEIMQEEIFGPVMPVKTYKQLDETIRYVNEHPRPLALYVFTDDKEKAEKVLNSTTSGGACVNETIFHVAQEELPFGGVGPSGTGAYHGFAGFETFSHAKSVFWQSKMNLAGMLRPPYGKKIDNLLGKLIPKG